MLTMPTVQIIEGLVNAVRVVSQVEELASKHPENPLAKEVLVITRANSKEILCSG